MPKFYKIIEKQIPMYTVKQNKAAKLKTESRTLLKLFNIHQRRGVLKIQ